MDAGRLERLHETARQAERHAVLVPELLAVSGRETKESRLGERLAVQIREQRRGGLVVADELAAVHVAVADAMLQRNAPLPSGAARGRARVRDGIARARAG